jgi:RNA polymerase sigma-70 factor (ECF subfamily)
MERLVTMDDLASSPGAHTPVCAVGAGRRSDAAGPTGRPLEVRRVSKRSKPAGAGGAAKTKDADAEARAALTASLVRVRDHRDRTAFEALFVHFAPRVKGYLMRQGADAGSAEELAQEALLSVWRKTHLFDPAKASASTWIFAIARNLRIDALRKEKRPEVDLDDPFLIPDPEPSPDKVVEQSEAEVLVEQALSRLPEDQAVVMRLSFFKGMSHGEIAEALGTPLGTVKSRLRLAFQKVREELGELR